MTPPVDRIEQGELGAGVGPFTVTDQSTPTTPPGQVNETGEFNDLGTQASGAVDLDGGTPCLFLNEEERLAHRAVDLKADGVVGVRFEQGTHHAM